MVVPFVYELVEYRLDLHFINSFIDVAYTVFELADRTVTLKSFNKKLHLSGFAYQLLMWRPSTVCYLSAHWTASIPHNYPSGATRVTALSTSMLNGCSLSLPKATVPVRGGLEWTLLLER